MGIYIDIAIIFVLIYMYYKYNKLEKELIFSGKLLIVATNMYTSEEIKVQKLKRENRDLKFKLKIQKEMA